MTPPPAEPDVLILGPATWNTILALDTLPAPRPHMVVAREAWDTVGGTSAGKALHLADLGVDARLLTPIGDDEAGRHVRAALAGLRVEALPTAATERHVNLMAADGGRVSIYAGPPATTTPPAVASVRDARAVVLDLAPWTRDLADELAGAGGDVWVDLHDVPDDAPWHEPFRRAATVVQCSADRLSDPIGFLRACVADGARLAVCTLGADGAVAVDAEGEHRVAAVPVDVVDTNGAGDGFLAGVLAATLDGASTPDALRAGARQAARAVATRDLAPGVRRD